MSEYYQTTAIEWAPALKGIAREMGERAVAMATGDGILVERKADGSQVTTIDKALNELLIRRAGQVFPEAAVWSEEGSTAPYGDLNAIRGRSLVLGDPIDGTDKLVRSLNSGTIDGCHSTIMLAAFAPDQTIPEAAVVYAPFLPQRPMYWADHSGAYLEHRTSEPERLQVAADGPTELRDVRSYKISRWNGCIPSMDDMSEMLPNASDKRDELRLTAVASGGVDLSIFPGASSNLHDIIPPLYIARQAGAATMALDGRPFEEFLERPVPGVLAAANQRLARKIIEYFGISRQANAS